jgi:hypothetical protein
VAAGTAEVKRPLVISSEAKQFSLPTRTLDCFVASLLAMTTRVLPIAQEIRET